MNTDKWQERIRMVESELEQARKRQNELYRACNQLRTQAKEADQYAGNWETAGEHIATVCMLIRNAEDLSQSEAQDAYALIAHLARCVRDPRTSVREIPF